jgi:hypothetical protein
MSKPINQLSFDISKMLANRNIKIGILKDSKNSRNTPKAEPSQTGKRGTTRQVDTVTNAEVLEQMEMRYNILSNPFVNKYTKNTNKEIDKYVNILTQNELSQADINKLENGLKSLFVSSILNNKTGRRNSPETVTNIMVEVKK